MKDNYALIRTQIHNYKEILCNKVIKHIAEEFPRARYDKEKCIRDMCLILDAVVADITMHEADHCTTAGLSYMYSYSSMGFANQKSYTVFAITELKKHTIELFDNPILQEQIADKFNTILEILSNNTIKEVKWWDFAARVAPFLALAIISLSHLIQNETLFHLSIIATIIVFFTTGVCWWWWSIYKIATTVIKIQQSQRKVQEISKEINHVKDEVKILQSNDSARKRRKSATSKSK